MPLMFPRQQTRAQRAILPLPLIHHLLQLIQAAFRPGRTQPTRRATTQLRMPRCAAPLPARRGTGRADTARNRRSRTDRRPVIVRIRVRGAGARRDERVRRRAGIAPRDAGRAAVVAARVARPAGAGGVLPYLPCLAAVAEEVFVATRHRAVAGADNGDRVPEDVGDVEVVGRVGFEDRASRAADRYLALEARQVEAALRLAGADRRGVGYHVAGPLDLNASAPGSAAVSRVRDGG